MAQPTFEQLMQVSYDQLGEAVEDNCRRCPLTSGLLASLPRLEKEFILFSALNPQSRIIPHVGTINGILRFHLGLLVPDHLACESAVRWPPGRRAKC